MGAGVLSTAPLDLFNANHQFPRHQPGTVTRYNSKTGVDEFVYVQVTTANAVAPTQRKLVYWDDKANGKTKTSTTGAAEDEVAGAIVAPTVTTLFYTWVKKRGKCLVLAYGTFATGDEVMADGSGYATDKSGVTKQTVAVAIAAAVGANAGAATNVYLDLRL